MWKTDGSAELKVTGNVLESQVSKSSGNVYNGLWVEDTEGMKSGKSYWQIFCEDLGDGGLFVGITDNQKFGTGWALKGLMYGGNLSSGGALLVGNFGPKPKSGDSLGIFVDMEGSSLKVFLDINGSSLGPAFDVPKSTLDEVLPVVSFSGHGKVSIEKCTDPTLYPHNTVRVQETLEGIEGTWEYVRGSIKNESHKVTLEIKLMTPISCRGSLRVVNKTQFGLTRQHPTDPWIGQCGSSTMMGGPPELMALENEMAKHVNGEISMESVGEELSTKNVENGSDSVWKRFTVTKGPVTENPFA